MCKWNNLAVYLRSTNQRFERSSALILLAPCHRTIQETRFQWSGGSITARNRGVNEALFVLVSSVHFIGLRRSPGLGTRRHRARGRTSAPGRFRLQAIDHRRQERRTAEDLQRHAME